MADILLEWHGWDRLRLRTISPSQILAIEKNELHYSIAEPSCREQSSIDRLVKLLWIGEFEFARKLIANSENRSLGSFEEYLFNLVICVQGSGWGGWHFSHPEHNHGVHYSFLYGNEAFKQSSMPLSDLLKMDVPCFSSIDGLVDVKFDKTELERVATIIPQELQKELRLPLILFGPLGDYPGKYRLVGSKIEEFRSSKTPKTH